MHNSLNVCSCYNNNNNNDDGDDDDNIKVCRKQDLPILIGEKKNNQGLFL